MNQNDVVTLLSEVREVLGPYSDRSGSVFYTGRQALKEGNFYLMGLNPGGDPDGPGTEVRLRESLNQWEEAKGNWSAYIHENWTKVIGNEGRSQHQKNVRYLCDEVLKESTANVFSANAVFLRSLDGTKLEMSKELLTRCWKLHVLFLRRVKPRVLICLGNGRGSSFDLVRKWAEINSDVSVKPCGFRGKDRTFVRWTDAPSSIKLVGDDRPLRILGVPHPSRYWYSSLNEFEKLIRSLVRETMDLPMS